MTDVWTVYVETDIEASEDEVVRVGDRLEEEGASGVMAAAPILGCRFQIDEPLPTLALGAAQSLFEVAVRRELRRRLAAEERNVYIVRAELVWGAEAERKPRGLATAAGLAKLVGRTPAWVRTLMRYEGHPPPVEIEGGREAVYDTELALKHLRRVTKSD